VKPAVPSLGRRAQRGMTLIEAVIAVAVLGVGMVALFGMMEWVARATNSLRFDAVATEAYARLAAQIRDATCEFDAADPEAPWAVDPGIDPADGRLQDWFGLDGPVDGSTVRAVGTTGEELADTAPRMRVEYRVRADETGGWGDTFGDAWTRTSMQVDVRVRRITNDPDKDDPDRVDGTWIKVYPVQKRCNPRVQAEGRGEYL
jgi:prepilin-type N-terminal cleavage/methylation domain-containing protein